jgi:hypothetical protein
VPGADAWHAIRDESEYHKTLPFSVAI